MNDTIHVTTEVESLVKKAESAKTSHEALQYSQAACNAANAMYTMRRDPKEPDKNAGSRSE